YVDSEVGTNASDYQTDRIDSQLESLSGGPVRAKDLDVLELLHFLPEGGIITFAGERVLLLDAVALGLLRRELIETLGVTAARAVLTRFGYAHGWRVAETLRRGFPWDSEDEWRAAGARLHTIQGIVRAEVTHGPSTCVSSRPPIAISSRTCMPRGFVRICTIVSGLSRSWYRRSANGARTSCRWRGSSLVEPPNDSGKRRRRLRPRPRTCCSGTHGPGMFANRRTRSSGPSSWRGLIASAQTTCRRRSAPRLPPFRPPVRFARSPS